MNDTQTDTTPHSTSDSTEQSVVGSVKTENAAQTPDTADQRADQPADVSGADVSARSIPPQISDNDLQILNPEEDLHGQVNVTPADIDMPDVEVNYQPEDLHTADSNLDFDVVSEITLSEHTQASDDVETVDISADDFAYDPSHHPATDNAEHHEFAAVGVSSKADNSVGDGTAGEADASVSDSSESMGLFAKLWALIRATGGIQANNSDKQGR